MNNVKITIMQSGGKQYRCCHWLDVSKCDFFIKDDTRNWRKNPCQSSKQDGRHSNEEVWICLSKKAKKSAGKPE